MKPIINLKRYPIDNLETDSAIDWLGQIRLQLNEQGSVVFPDFILPEALTEMARQARSITHLAYPGPREVTPYFFNYDLCKGQDLPQSHPLRRKGKRNLAQVATDLIPQDFILTQLYHNDQLCDFLSAILNKPVYRNEDPYQSLNLSVMDKGGCQQWHFDSGNMVTTLLLQEPELGGEFEYVPAIRSDQNENFDAVQAVLDGDRSQVRQLKLRAASLSLFRGHYSLHRVTEVSGERQRLQAILGYTTKANHVGNRDSSILHYGPRVAEIEATKPRYLD